MIRNNYKDVTKEWLNKATPNSHKIVIDNYYIDEDGISHPIKNKEKLCAPQKNSDEYKVAVIIENILGGKINLKPRIETAKGYKGIISVPTPDYIWNNEKWDLKTPTTNGKFSNTVERFFKKSKKVKKQAHKFIIDYKYFPHKTNSQIIKIVKKTLNNPYRQFIDAIIILRGQNIIKIFVKKQ